MQTLENLINKKVKQRKYINLVYPKKKEVAKGNDPAPENRTKNHDMDRCVKSKVQSNTATQIQIINIAHKHISTTTSY